MAVLEIPVEEKGVAMNKIKLWMTGGLIDFFIVALVFGVEGTKSSSENKRTAGMLATETMAVNAKDFGVVGDGKTDDTKALQAALDAAVAKGPVCYLPGGHYKLDGSLVVPRGVTLYGASGGVPHSEHPIGTVLLAYGGKR